MSEPTVVLFFIVLVVLQAVLSLKSTSRVLRWSPTAGCLLSAVLSFGLGFLVEDAWTGAAYWVMGTMFLILLMGCGLGWLTAFLIRRTRRVMDSNHNRIGRK